MRFLPPHWLHVSSPYVYFVYVAMQLHHHYINTIPSISLPFSLSFSFFLLLTVLISSLIMGRPPCCDKSNVKKGPWTPEEDAKVLAYIANHGIGNWTLVPEKAGLLGLKSYCAFVCVFVCFFNEHTVMRYFLIIFSMYFVVTEFV